MRINDIIFHLNQLSQSHLSANLSILRCKRFYLFFRKRLAFVMLSLRDLNFVSNTVN